MDVADFDELRRLWEAQTNDIDQRSAAAMHAFRAEFLVDAIMFREELVKRLPHSQRSTPGVSPGLYKHAPNMLSVKEIADDLERKAKLLE
jgi:hypothetical protein